MGDVQRPGKVDDTCVKTVHAGMVDRGFTLFLRLYIHHLSFKIFVSCYKLESLRLWHKTVDTFTVFTFMTPPYVGNANLLPEFSVFFDKDLIRSVM
jgi:hypothetical protein